jgi:hypothetical protein
MSSCCEDDLHHGYYPEEIVSVLDPAPHVAAFLVARGPWVVLQLAAALWLSESHSLSQSKTKRIC